MTTSPTRWTSSHDDEPPDEVPRTRTLSRPEGRIAYDVAGDGPLVVLVPGMGDLRSTYRFITPALRPVGYRVAVTDLRGHGDSDTTFMSDDDAATAADVLALIEELGGPAVIVGNSMGPGAAAFTAAERPDIVSGLVLIGPFVRNPDRSTFNRIMLRVAMAPAWAATSWKSYVPRLYAGRKPADFDANLAAPKRRTISSGVDACSCPPASSASRSRNHSLPDLLAEQRQDPEVGGSYRCRGLPRRGEAGIPRGAGLGQAALKRRSRRLLVTTKMELNAMAAPAMRGLRSPRAARGIAATL